MRVTKKEWYSRPKSVRIGSEKLWNYVQSMPYGKFTEIVNNHLEELMKKENGGDKNGND